MHRVFIFTFIITLTGCVYIKQPDEKLKVHQLSPLNTKNHLIIILPGITDSLDTLRNNKLLKKIYICNPDVNIIYVNAHFGFYRTKTIVERLHKDIILPAHNKGISDIWLFGISLGGLGSLTYHNKHPDMISGVITLAPFLGLTRDFNLYQLEKNNKIYLKDFINFWQKTEKTLSLQKKVYLGFTKGDNYFKQQQWLADFLPEEHVTKGSGAHDWSSWKKIINKLLDSTPLCKS